MSVRITSRAAVVVVALAVALCALVGSAHATVIIQTDPGTVRTTAGITTFQTEGDDMVGMEVTAFFATGASETAVWAATGPGSGAAAGTTGNGWSLSVSGDTYGATWGLVNNSGLTMAQVLIDGTAGQTVFDRDWVGEGTPNSAAGWDFTEVSFPAGLEVTATYTDILAVGASPPVGDCWVILDLEFTSAGDLPSGSSLSFEQDTDNASSSIVPQEPVIPEPTTLSLLALGGLVLLRRRRRVTRDA
jgi:hypothetical protein